jgi:hypothetical protein
VISKEADEELEAEAGIEPDDDVEIIIDKYAYVFKSWNPEGVHRMVEAANDDFYIQQGAILAGVMTRAQLVDILVNDTLIDDDLGPPYDYLLDFLDPPLTPDEFAGLAEHVNYGPRLAIARRPECPPEVLALLVEDPDLDVRLAAARNPSLDPADLVRVAIAADERVRQVIIDRPDVEEHIKAAIVLSL